MDEPESVIVQKRMAAIKLAKNLEEFNPDLGEEFDAVYIETLTEEMKQAARELKKLAKIVGTIDAADTWESWHRDLKLPLMVTIDGEEERVTKMMRRYCTRIQKMADLIYEVAFIDYGQLQQDELKRIMEVDDDGDDDEDPE